MFQQVIKFDYLVLAIYQSVYWFMINIFDKLAPPSKYNMSQKML